MKTASKSKGPITAKYAGVCKRTGKEYGPGTRIVQGANGWEIAGNAKVIPPADFRRVQMPDGDISTLNLALALICRCAKEAVPDWKERHEAHKDQYSYPPGLQPHALVREGETLHCHFCDRTLTLCPKYPKPDQPGYIAPETRVCWECGCTFTYADCKRSGGDWSDNYCGC